uniref:Uncharacterized protein n=1 Tax=Zea mays TaxID=4577 RepID=A0A804RT15_MAIZE
MDGAEARDPHPAIWASDMAPMSSEGRGGRRKNPGREPGGSGRRQGKSAKRIRNFGKRIGSEGWARGSRPRTVGCWRNARAARSGESGAAACRPGGTDRERPPRGPSPGVEQPTQN